MPTYEYRCAYGHVTEVVQSIHDDLPEQVPCGHIERLSRFQAMSMDRADRNQWFIPLVGQEITQASEDTDVYEKTCPCAATRVFTPPAAIHYHGTGFYTTDVKGKQERRRKPNPGDTLPRAHDPAAAAIARSL